MNDNLDYKQFIAKRHSKIKTDDEIIDNVVKKAMGQTVLNKNRIIEGEANEVYDITLSNNSRVIARISPKSEGRFLQEQIAIEKCRNADVPVPKIFYVGILPDTDNKQIILEEKLEGDSLSSIKKSLSEDELKRIAVKSGEILAKIHSISIEKYGWLDKNGNGTYENQTDYILLKTEKKKDLYLSIAKKITLNPKTILGSLYILRKYLDLYKNAKSVLLHNDYGPKHIFVKDNIITGIIDFENAGGGDPLMDIARYDYFYSQKIPTELLIEGYTDKSIFDDTFLIKIHLYRIWKGLGLLDYYNKTENTGGLNHVKKMFDIDMNFFNNL